MNGFIKRSVALVCIGGAAAIAGGCCKETRLADYYDNCWPERYNYQARQSVDHTFGAQVNNGHILDQTVWSYHFEAGTAILTAGGMEHLQYLARRRPQPDSHIFLQTAQDVQFNPAMPEQYAAERSKRDADRVIAIQQYLNAETSGRPVPFNVTIHDPGPVGLPAPFAARAIANQGAKGYPGVLTGTSGGTTSTTTGNATQNSSQGGSSNGGSSGGTP